mmetsp:Transcript_10453/g.33107  ORF Transcript_10453/g.33107 Transcript_10453/m.33107 type:complete len:220 (-) Transcript_10453:224-883(-)
MRATRRRPAQRRGCPAGRSAPRSPTAQSTAATTHLARRNCGSGTARGSRGCCRRMPRAAPTASPLRRCPACRRCGRSSRCWRSRGGARCRRGSPSSAATAATSPTAPLSPTRSPRAAPLLRHGGPRAACSAPTACLRRSCTSCLMCCSRRRPRARSPGWCCTPTTGVPGTRPSAAGSASATSAALPTRSRGSGRAASARRGSKRSSAAAAPPTSARSAR